LREGRPSLADFAGDPETMMTKFNGHWACAWFWSAPLAAGIGPNAVQAADLAEPLAREIVRQDAAFTYGYGGFNPILDPRRRIVPQPEAALSGDTARFCLAAVCESRSLYRIRTCFRNFFVMSSLSFSFLLHKNN
jgi:hypothetical protein